MTTFPVPFNLNDAAPASRTVAPTSPLEIAALLREAAGGPGVLVRATGHGMIRPPGATGLTVLDLAQMTGVDVDAAAGTITAYPGTRWRAVIDAVAGSGRTVLHGSSPTVGAIGYTLGGGLPVLNRTFGWAADRVLRAQMVTGDGQIREVDAARHPDLFWALPTAKSSLGVVTSLTFASVPRPELHTWTAFYPLADARRVLAALDEILLDAPASWNCSVALRAALGDPRVPAPARAVPHLQVRAVIAGDDDALERSLTGRRPLAQWHDRPVTDLFLDPQQPLPFVEAGGSVERLDRVVREACVEAIESGALHVVEMRHLGGAMTTSPPSPSSLELRAAGFTVLGIAVGGDEAATAVGAFVRRLAPAATLPSSLNQQGVALDAFGAPSAWTPATSAELLRLAGRYDPHGVMRGGHRPVVQCAK